MELPEPVHILPHHGEALLYAGFFSAEESDRLFAALLTETNWRHSEIMIFGRPVLQPRLTASYADEGVDYGYSGIRLKSDRWTESLMEIRKRVEGAAGCRFNTALLNLYRDGRDSMGWHRDNEKELGPAPVIASVSLGATRKFQLREYKIKSPVISLWLEQGSLLLMRGESQHHWQHRLPKTPHDAGARINITFRQVMTPGKPPGTSL